MTTDLADTLDAIRDHLNAGQLFDDHVMANRARELVGALSDPEVYRDPTAFVATLKRTAAYWTAADATAAQ